ncbi:sensor histidine kinase [Promicromonospora sp. NPDC090134]|uniref:sensor histidine kinase n=1 Tax=Promicromonospora sp. NPDC090134 TaxID=3364408 RepID=UPI0038039E96
MDARWTAARPAPDIGDNPRFAASPAAVRRAARAARRARRTHKDHPKGGARNRPVGGDRDASALTLRLTRWVGRDVVAVTFVANIVAYLGALALLDQTRAVHTAQTEDWRVVAVVLLVSFQALWLHWLQRQAFGTLCASLVLWFGALLIGGADPLLLQPGVLLAVFSYAAQRPGRWRGAAVVVLVVATAVVLLADEALYPTPGGPGWRTPAMVVTVVLNAVGVVAVPALLGAWYAQLRDRAERIAALAHEIAGREAHRTADAVAATRRTLAQELHDTSSAHLAAILTLSTAAEASTTAGGGPDPRLITQIRDEGERLYQGFERMVSRMRQDDRTVAETHQPGQATGQHTIAQVPDLTAEHQRVADVPVTLRHDPDLTEIDQRLGPLRSHTAYRVVQEALSNTRKHAPGTGVTVVLEDDGTSLLLRVENESSPVPGASIPGGAVTGPHNLSLGYGIEGMRDRLAAVGGSLRTGPRHGGGWAVQALLPHPPHRTGTTDG